MIGFALEGGGAKGAYQVGAYIALLENHIKPSVIAGTSIGALNAALMAQGDIKKLKQLWESTTTDIFGINSDLITKIKHKKITKEDILIGYDNIKLIIENKGIDVSKYLEVISSVVDENKLRKSKIKFALITVKIDGLEPLELTIDDIPYGKVAEYILASSYLPIFKSKPIIDNNYYLDGGFYNNIPLSLVEKLGCDTIYSIRIKGIGFSRNKLKSTTNVIEIKPNVNLGSIILFDKDSTNKNMKLGYFDTLKVIKKLDGNIYYFKYYNNHYYNKLIKFVPIILIDKLKFKYKTFDSKELVIRIVENILMENNIEIFKIRKIKKEIRYIKKNIKLKNDLIIQFFSYCK